jgi:hypothetical protein
MRIVKRRMFMMKKCTDLRNENQPAIANNTVNNGSRGSFRELSPAASRVTG